MDQSPTGHYSVQERLWTPRRVVTAPAAPQVPTNDSGVVTSGLVDTLYVHPNVRLVSFDASKLSSWKENDSSLELSWSNQLERTIAIGLFRIYRAPGSVAFLNCGSVLQPILPKSQCWAVDEANTKFVLRIRHPYYWRIELPATNEEEREIAGVLRGVLDSVLQLEKISCPFQRSFSVDIPESPRTPVTRKAWVPRHISPGSTALQNFHNADSGLITSSTSPRDSGASRNPVERPVEFPRYEPRAPAFVIVGETIQMNAEGFRLTEAPGFDTKKDGAISDGENVVIDVSATPLTVLSSNKGDLSEDLEHRITVPTMVRTIDTRCAQRPGTKSNNASSEESLSLQRARLTEVECASQRDFFQDVHRGTLALLGRSGPQILDSPRPSNALEASSLPLRPASIPSVQSSPLQPSEFASEFDQCHSRTSSADSSQSTESFHSAKASLLSSASYYNIGTFDKPSLCETDLQETRSTSLSENITSRAFGVSAMECIPDSKMEIEEFSEHTIPSLDLIEDPLPLDNQPSLFMKHASLDAEITRRQRSMIRSHAHSTITQSNSKFQSFHLLGSFYAVKNLPLDAINKLWEIVLGPPSFLVTLMLKIAAKIAAGEWKGQMDELTGEGSELPVCWDIDESDGNKTASST